MPTCTMAFCKLFAWRDDLHRSELIRCPVFWQRHGDDKWRGFITIHFKLFHPDGKVVDSMGWCQRLIEAPK